MEMRLVRKGSQRGGLLMGYQHKATAERENVPLPVDLSQRSYLLSRLEWVLRLQEEACRSSLSGWSAFTAQVAVNAALRDCQKAGIEGEAWAVMNGQKRADRWMQVDSRWLDRAKRPLYSPRSLL